MSKIKCESQTTKVLKKYTLAEWLKTVNTLYGKHMADWKFKCPCCKKIMSGKDYKDAGVPIKEIPDVIGFSCIGRWHKENISAFSSSKNPKNLYCTYAGGGLFNFLPVSIQGEDGEDHYRMEFADDLQAAN